ncbi:hypothetical protein PVT67_00605 [Gallaecimonas kandeliae]|uniref:hypothetical protein n=1 Tax=Gallaecimonas kandeliae TaxID=3029055 RepID=UPI0026475FBC|nr:hypothetical protein [Gallaecimonas kandeliae]WKE65790.1 hypothetical protein PVT67_00605 [Gallaecimonas kandeliae]
MTNHTELLFSIDEVAKKLSVQPTTIKKWIRYRKHPGLTKHFNSVGITRKNFDIHGFITKKKLDRYLRSKDGLKLLEQAKRKQSGPSNSRALEAISNNVPLNDSRSICNHSFKHLSHPIYLSNRPYMKKIREGNSKFQKFIFDKEKFYVIFDKLSVVGEIEQIAMTKLRQGLFDGLKRCFGKKAKVRREFKNGNLYLYAYCVEVKSQVIHLSLYNKKRNPNQIRLEFNPDKLQPRHLIKLLTFIKKKIGSESYCDFYDSLKVTRVDIAIDIKDAPIHSVISNSRSNEIMKFSGSNKPDPETPMNRITETRTLGSKHGCQLKIYDKATELLSTQGIDFGHFLTRIEWKIIPGKSPLLKRLASRKLSKFKVPREYFMGTKFYNIGIIDHVKRKEQRQKILNDGLDSYLDTIRDKKYLRRFRNRLNNYLIEFPYLQLSKEANLHIKEWATFFRYPVLSSGDDA